MSFYDVHAGTRYFAKTIFELRQTVPTNEKIDSVSYLPGRTAVTSALKELTYKMRKRLLIDIEEGMIRYGGAVIVADVHLKLEGKHFCDFTVHFREIKDKGLFENVHFKIQTMTFF